MRSSAGTTRFRSMRQSAGGSGPGLCGPLSDMLVIPSQARDLLLIIGRSLALLGLTVLLACSDKPSSKASVTDSAAAKATTIRGPDALFLRIPRAGGAVRVVAFPNIDSTVWSSSSLVDAPGRVLGFDDDAGVLAMIDAKKRPVLVDFRTGKIDDEVRFPIDAAMSVDGSTIYGVTARGDVVRRSTSDSLRMRINASARGVFPLRDGSLLVWSGAAGRGMLS